MIFASARSFIIFKLFNVPSGLK